MGIQKWEKRGKWKKNSSARCRALPSPLIPYSVLERQVQFGGSCIGPYDARKRGLTGVAQASFVAKTIGKFGFQCGLVAGVFTATCCGIQRYRRQNDWVNPLIAGAVAGAAVAAGTRSWTQVVGMAGLVSAFSVAADYSKTF